MKLRLLFSILAAMLLAISTNAQDKAETTSQPWRTQVGVGIGYQPFGLYSISGTSFMAATGLPVSFYVPIRTSPSLTIEPEFGVYAYSSESTSSGVTTDNSASVVRLGAGVLATVATTSNTRLYVGPRVGVYLVKQKSTYTYYPPSTTDMTETDFTIGGSVGAEYFFVESMSLGGETLLTYYAYGEPTYSSPASTSSTPSRRMFSSNVIFFLRWYF